MIEGTELDELPDGEGEFGLDIDNPVPVKGIPESREYLQQIILEEQEINLSTNWIRRGSGKTKTRNLPVDIYILMDQNDRQLKRVYVWPYNKVTSKKIPKGFKSTLNFLF